MNRRFGLHVLPTYWIIIFALRQSNRKATAGPSTPLRSAQDDRVFVLQSFMPDQSSPERSWSTNVYPQNELCFVYPQNELSS
jgi:hypothetical protein